MLHVLNFLLNFLPTTGTPLGNPSVHIYLSLTNANSVFKLHFLVSSVEINLFWIKSLLQKAVFNLTYLNPVSWLLKFHE